MVYVLKSISKVEQRYYDFGGNLTLGLFNMYFNNSPIGQITIQTTRSHMSYRYKSHISGSRVKAYYYFYYIILNNW